VCSLIRSTCLLNYYTIQYISGRASITKNNGIMKALFVVTTKDLPMSGFSLVNEKYAKQVGDLLRSTILDHDNIIINFI